MKYKVPVFFIIPSLMFFIMIRIVPLVQGLLYSLTNWNGYDKKDFIGFANFTRLILDPGFLNSIKVTAIFVVLVVVFQNLIGLFFALLLNKAGSLSNFYRSSIFIPNIISQVAVAFLWKNILTYNGILDIFLKNIGLESLVQRWLTDPKLSIISVAGVEIWRAAGFCMVIILAALQSVPIEIYEAANIDGCNSIYKFFKITLPLIIPGISVSLVLTTIGALKQFAIVKVLTNGGPINSTETISFKILTEAFDYNRQGYASAIAVVLFFTVVTVTLLQNTILKKKEVEY